MNLKKLKQTLHEIRYFKKIIKKYGDFLLQGRYRLFPSLRAIVNDNAQSVEKAKPYFEKNKGASKTASLINKINKTNYYFNKRKCALGKYEAVYSANNYDKVREIKLFSFAQKEILTVCTDKKTCGKQILQYETLHNYFGMPRVDKFDEIENAYKISMVEVLTRPSDDDALKDIIECTLKVREENYANLKRKTVSEILNFDSESEEAREMLSELASKLTPDMLGAELPTCFQHGDLSRDNLIYGKCEDVTGFWWIDWEHARDRVFFYDYFFYVLNTAMYFSDKSALNSYLSGKYDDCLTNWFEQFGITYDASCRKEYFIVFAIDFLKQRVSALGNIKALKNYCDFIKEIIK